MHVRTILLPQGARADADNTALAVSRDGSWVAVARRGVGIQVFSLPDGAFVRCIDRIRSGDAALVRVLDVEHICCNSTGSIVLARHVATGGGASKLHEISDTGESVRVLGRDGGFGSVLGLDSRCGVTVAVVLDREAAVPLVLVFCDGTGSLQRQFPLHSLPCYNVNCCRITPDAMAAVCTRQCTAVFRLTGEHERALVNVVDAESDSGRHCKNPFNDVAFADNGDVIVSDFGSHCVRVYRGSLACLHLRGFGGCGDGNGNFNMLVALQASGGRLFVLDRRTPRVQVFE